MYIATSLFPEMLKDNWKTSAHFGNQASEVCVTGYRYMIHFYCLAVEAGFYSDVVECLPVNPATWVRFPAGAGRIFSPCDNGAHRK